MAFERMQDGRCSPGSTPERDMSVIALSPVPVALVQEERPGPALASIEGRTIGFRVEYIWPAYHVVADEWSRLFQERGARTVTWNSTTHLDTPAGVRSPIDDFIDEVDFAVVGLGNCGSCTSWAIHDTVKVLDGGKGAVGVVTEEFEKFGRQVARRANRAGMRVHVLPFPLVTRDKDELKEIAREHFGRLMRTCGLPV
jgi:hypothetical protein